MKNSEVKLFPHLTHEVVSDISGFKLCSYLVALEGWRRGLDLKWYRDETELCKLDRLNSSTQGKFFSLSSNDRTHYFFRSRGDKVSNKAVRICQDKEETKTLLRENKVPIPLGGVFEEDGDIIEYAESVGFPIVIKPLRGSMGKGVYTNINNTKELKAVLSELRSTYNYAEYIVEKHYPGKEYRIYVVGDQVIGATNRVPANVDGDGKSSIAELIKMKNKERKGNPYLSPKPIKVDYEIRSSLKSLGYDINSVPKKGEKVFLRDKSNLSSGGDPIEATDELSKEVKQIAVDALKALPSIPHAGVDIIVDPNNNNKGVVLEANATAEIGFHLFPLKGKARDVPSAIIDYYFPETKNLPKSPFYFDYHSILEPLKYWSAEEVKITPPPSNKVYSKKYIVSGKVQKVGYMNFIRRQALRKGYYGYSKKIDDNKIEIIVMSENKDELSQFIEVCYKGSKKSRVEHVTEEDIKIIESPVKIGFQIITT